MTSRPLEYANSELGLSIEARNPLWCSLGLLNGCSTERGLNDIGAVDEAQIKAEGKSRQMQSRQRENAEAMHLCDRPRVDTIVTEDVLS